MLYAYQVAVNRRAKSAIGLAVASILNLYTGYLAIPVTLAAFGFVGVVYLVGLFKKPRTLGVKPVLLQLAPGVVAGLATVLAYLPWLPSLLYFSARSGADMYADTSSTILSVLDLLGFPSLVMGLLGLGLASCIVYWRRGGWPSILLLFLFLLLPILAFWLRFHDALLNLIPRYFACIVLSLTLLAAMGIEMLALTSVRLISYLRRNITHHPTQLARTTLRVAYAIVLFLLLLHAVPALTISYAVPKDDNRGAANLVVDGSPPGVAVLAMHTGDTVFRVESLEYYFWRRGSTIPVVDAAKL